MRIGVLSGSLRAASSNGALLRVAAALAPAGMELVFYEGLAGLPHFNPDLDGEGAVPPAPVAGLRALLAGCQGLVVCSPEYAHGVPGALKNGLDWLVSSGELVGKPVVLLNASAQGGQHAQASLAETLRVMSAQVLEASLTGPFLRRRLAPGQALDDPQAEAALRRCLQALAAAVDEAAG